LVIGAGQGERHCSAIGRDVNSWGGEIEAIRADFQAASLGQEVERLREAVGKRLKELDRRERLLERRERELNLLRERANRHAAAKHFVAGSQPMQDVLELAARVASRRSIRPYLCTARAGPGRRSSSA
jgi:hypothetical protein